MSLFCLCVLCVCVCVCVCMHQADNLKSHYTPLLTVPMRIWSFKAKHQISSESTMNFSSCWQLFYLRMTDWRPLFTQIFFFYLLPHRRCARRDCVRVDFCVREEVHVIPRGSPPAAPLPEYKKLTLSLVPHCDTRPLRRPQTDSHGPRHIAGGPHHETAKTTHRRLCCVVC